MATTLQSVGQISIRTKDLPSAVAFYRDQLGLEFLFEAGPALAFFVCGDVRLMLSVPESPEFDHPSSTVYFRVDDLGAAYEELRGRGVPFDDEPHLIAKMPDHELWMAFFRDSENNILALMSEVPPGASSSAGHADRVSPRS
jgi:methylmalonyl-CoA/ethylmalonyl-CoA epimerase